MNSRVQFFRCRKSDHLRCMVLPYVAHGMGRAALVIILLHIIHALAHGCLAYCRTPGSHVTCSCAFNLQQGPVQVGVKAGVGLSISCVSQSGTYCSLRVQLCQLFVYCRHYMKHSTADMVLFVAQLVFLLAVQCHLFQTIKKNLNLNLNLKLKIKN